MKASDRQWAFTLVGLCIVFCFAIALAPTARSEEEFMETLSEHRMDVIRYSKNEYGMELHEWSKDRVVEVGNNIYSN